MAPDAKEAARDQVAAAVKAGGFGAREVFIRVNGVDTPWHSDDLAAAAAAAPDAILVPKVQSPETLELIGRRLLDMGTDHQTRVWAMIETPLAIFNILPIAAAARDSEIAAFRLRHGHQRSRQGNARAAGAGPRADAVLAVDLRRRRAHRRHRHPRRRLQRYRQCRRLQMECTQGVEFGFDGKTLIHPNQISPCNAAFSPSEEEVAWARKMIADFDKPENKGKGVVSIDGRMVERLHAEMARRTVAIAEAIAARGLGRGGRASSPIRQTRSPPREPAPQRTGRPHVADLDFGAGAFVLFRTGEIQGHRLGHVAGFVGGPE